MTSHSAMPRVSVILPCHNADGSLARAVQSVLAQTFGDLELIIVDDGSRDGSAGMARLLAIEDRRVRALRQAREGTAAACNRGIDAARGEYLAFLDARDAWSPQRLTRHLAYMDHAPECGVTLAQTVSETNDMSAWRGPTEPRATASGGIDILAHRAVFAEAGPFNAEAGDAAGEWIGRVLALTDWEIHGVNAAGSAPRPAPAVRPASAVRPAPAVRPALAPAGWRALFAAPAPKLLAG